MPNRVLIPMMILMVIMAFAVAPVWAAEVVEIANPYSVQQQQNDGSGGEGDSGTVGGIQPVSPEKFGSKVQQLGNTIYDATSPITDVVAKLGIAFSGLILIFVLVLGTRVLVRVVGSIAAVAMGIFLWYGAPYIVGIFKYLAAWLQS